MPTVNPVLPGNTLIEVPDPLVHDISVNRPQLPDSNWTYLVTPDVKLVPKLFTSIVGNADCATKEYQTSAPGVPPQLLVTVGVELVEYAKVPVVAEQDDPEFKVTAPVHRSFVGGPGSVMQILKVPVELLLESTLI